MEPSTATWGVEPALGSSSTANLTADIGLVVVVVAFLFLLFIFLRDGYLCPGWLGRSSGGAGKRGGEGEGGGGETGEPDERFQKKGFVDWRFWDFGMHASRPDLRLGGLSVHWEQVSGHAI